MAPAAAALKLGKPVYTLLAVICGKKVVEPKVDGAEPTASDGATNKSGELLPNVSAVENDAFLLPEKEKSAESKGNPALPGYPDLVSEGQLEVQLFEYPSKEELKTKLETLQPEFVFFHGEQVSGKDDVGGLVLGEEKPCTPEELVTVFGSKLPDLVYLELPSGDKCGQALRTLGIKHVIYWKLSSCTHTLAFHFRQGLVAALQSSAAGGYDTYHLAKSCSQIYACRSRLEGHSVPRSAWAHLLGDAPPKIEVITAGAAGDGDNSKASEAARAAIQIFDDDVEIRMLVCTEINKPENAWMDAMEGGLSNLLTIEGRALRMLNKISAPPPPMAAAVFARGIVTMRCDICTASYARVALLVSGSAQLCFDDQQLENSIKKELVEKVRLVRVLKPVEDRRNPMPPIEMRRSTCIASGARTVELKIMTPAWAGQVLRQLAANPTYRSLVALGIAALQGSPVAAFKKDDALLIANSIIERPMRTWTGPIPSWFVPPPPTKKRVNLFRAIRNLNESPNKETEYSKSNNAEGGSSAGAGSSSSAGKADKRAAGKIGRQNSCLPDPMRPLPHKLENRPNPYAALLAAFQAGSSVKANPPNGTSGKLARPNSGSMSTNGAPKESQGVTPGSLLLAVNAPHVKPHGCSRRPIDDCAEEDFIADLIKFLVSRGHGRLIPPVGAEGFPEVVLNGKRLDLYNLYREVVSRGGFHVGNGINWKGQVFSKMRNHTHTNKMTGVGNTLKKHYETYLLEYELAHNDVDGECCILCHSGAAGDWVNCGSCGEWAHFGCDKRTGLGTFKEYSKTDGLEYICPNCSTANGRLTKRKKTRHTGRGGQTEAAVVKGVPRKTAR